MVKDTALSKAELQRIVNTSKVSKEINKAVKQLKKFAPTPRREFDDEAKESNFKVENSHNPCAFVCFRCDRVKQTKTTIKFQTSQGLKKICSACYTGLREANEVAAMKVQNQRLGLVPKMPSDVMADSL